MWSEMRARRLVETSRFRQAAVPNFDQYWSELRTTPSVLARIAIQTAFAIEFLMNLTLPSPKPTFTPPGCILRLWPPLLYMPLPQLKPMPCWAAFSTCKPKTGPACISSPPSLQPWVILKPFRLFGVGLYGFA